MSSETKIMKQVDEAMAQMQETVAFLEKHFEELKTRLCPVVSSVPAKADKTPDDPPRVPLANTIIALSRRVERVNCEMAETLEGLEL
jgi:Tfp pilus assembly protein PilE